MAASKNLLFAPVMLREPAGHVRHLGDECSVGLTTINFLGIGQGHRT